MSATGTPETRALVRRIQDVRFTTGRVRTSYDMNDVDELLDKLVDTIETGGDPRPLMTAAQFRTVRWSEGYTLGEVDNFLDALLLDPALVPAGTEEFPIPAPVTTKAGGRAASKTGNAPAASTPASSSKPMRSTAPPPKGSMPPPPLMPAPPVAPRSSRSSTPAPAAPPPAGTAPGGTTRRGGRTVGGMLLDHLDETGKKMPAGRDAELVLASAKRLDTEAAKTPQDVIAIAIEVADIVLAAAAIAENYGFTVEEAVREKTRLDQESAKG